MVKRQEEAHATKLAGGDVPSTDSYRRKNSLYFLDDPVDKCMIKALFRQDDDLMKFYEQKYKFQPKEIRPFAQHTNTKDQNPIHNEKLFKQEVDKVRKSQELKKKEDEKKYR